MESFLELLRIAYKFADGGAVFMNLVVGVCDLKPLLFWLTVHRQVALAKRFAELPFAIVGGARRSTDHGRGDLQPPCRRPGGDSRRSIARP